MKVVENSHRGFSWYVKGLHFNKILKLKKKSTEVPDFKEKLKSIKSTFYKLRSTKKS